MTESRIKSLSEAIFDPIDKAYKTGGYGLVFISLGAFLMLAATFTGTGILEWSLLLIGFILILLSCTFFYMKEIRPLSIARKSINQSKEIIDAVQHSAIELTELALTLQALAFKYADQVADLFQELKPQIKTLPIVGQLFETEIAIRTETISSSIVEYTLKSKTIIQDIEQALETSNAEGLRKYITQIKELTSQAEDILKK